jgi:hypothetical protein
MKLKELKMNKILIFILGIITGIVLTFVFATALTTVGGQSDSGATWFEAPGDCLIHKSSLKIFQVIAPDAALAMIKDDFGSPVYLITNKENKTYYDDQVIKLPSKSCFKQVGTYQYETKEQMLKTVPIVQIM